MKDKTNLKIIIAVIVSVIISSGVTAFAAIKFQANEIGYNTTTVADALDSLYQTKFSDNYSTTEKAIGKWVDGSVIYQKTIQITTPNSSSDYRVLTYDQISDNIDYIIKAEGIILDSRGGINIPSHYGGSDMSVISWANSGNTGIYMRATNTLVYASRTAYITVLYTKTTN